MAHKPDHVERGGEVHADTPDKWSEDDTARQERGQSQGEDEHSRRKGHDGLKGTDTPATTDASYIDREKGKRTTM